MTKLPIPSADAAEHSDKLIQLIKKEITENGGSINFARYMELVLYAPGLGYYSAGSQKFGAEGDFITAPLISPLFAQCIAQQCKQILSLLVDGDILELGAGSGKFACDLLQELDQLDSLPANYFILEVSAELRERQQILLQETCPHLFSRIHWLDRLPPSINGVIFANEVLDAMPLAIFRIDENGTQEKHVTIQDDQLGWNALSPTPELLVFIENLRQEYGELHNYESEINLMLPSFIQSLSQTLKQGILLLVDYGFGRREYYHPDRNTGTLMCHYQHHRHSDPLLLPGLQDITAHVDFTTVVESAVDAHLDFAGYTTQAAFLFSCGLMTLAERDNALSQKEQYKKNQAIKMLTLPSQMGEIIKVIALSKNINKPLLGFTLHDRSKDL